MSKRSGEPRSSRRSMLAIAGKLRQRRIVFLFDPISSDRWRRSVLKMSNTKYLGTSRSCGVTRRIDFEDRPPPAVGAYWVKEEDYPALPKLSGDGKHRSARRSRLAGSLRRLLRDGGQPHRRGEIVVVF